MPPPPKPTEAQDHAVPLEALLGRERTVHIGRVFGGAVGLLLAEHAPQDTPLLVVVPDVKRGEAVRLDLEAFGTRAPSAFPAWPPVDAREVPDADVLVARARALAELGADRAPALVTTLQALAQPVPSPAVFEAAALTLAQGEERALPTLHEFLAAAGYARVGAVESPGQFAPRGGLLDVWSWDAREPVRLDFFGDEIESIRRLDPQTQRSDDARAAVAICTLPPERFRDPHRGEGAASLLDHLPDETPLVLLEQEALVGAATALRGSGAGDGVAVLERELSKRRTWVLCEAPASGTPRVDVAVRGLDALRGLAVRSVGRKEDPAERGRRVTAAFEALLDQWDEVVIFRRAVGEQERLDELLDEAGAAKNPTWRSGTLSRSFVWEPTKTAYVAYDDLADLPLRDRRARALQRRMRPVQDFLELKQDGLIVHLHHGIGVYRGLVTLDDGSGDEGEFLKTEFAEGTVVYVPVHRIDLVQRYVGAGRPPRLSKIGGTEWANRKKKVSAAVEALAEDLLATQAQRVVRHGQPLPNDTEWQQEFEDAFPFPATPDQTAALAAIKDDLQSERPMDRLLCGDVGYGKTEVALRAIFKVVTAGRQAAVLVPTKVLAAQHVRTFARRLAPYPVRVRALTGLQSAAENRRSIEGLRDGTIDVVVGTHRLLSKDVGFSNLGLVVIDEEQRFGVKHKERLKTLRDEVDVLALSATPIPRTLHMALLGIRDISNLTTPPLGRHPIDTKVSREDDAVVRDTIRRELARGGQMFVVNPRILDLPMVEAWLIRLVPELRVTSIHGRMDKEKVEARMLRFVRGDVDLMLATTIIESGLDIPNANTIVVRDAHRYGLAELHQLRGRVGRERRRAHALLLLPKHQPIRPEATERLRAIEEYSELGAGFRIAMRDLEIRGAGNLLGPQQSGHIAAVGYELYCRLLGDAVSRARGRKPAGSGLAYLGIDLPGGIPDGYASDVREKFQLFRRITALESVPAIDAFREELKDRFGPVPRPVERLLLAQEARVRLGALGVERIAPAPSDAPGVVLRAPARALDDLRGRFADLRRLGDTSAFLPPEEGRRGPRAHDPRPRGLRPGRATAAREAVTDRIRAGHATRADPVPDPRPATALFSDSPRYPAIFASMHRLCSLLLGGVVVAALTSGCRSDDIAPSPVPPAYARLAQSGGIKQASKAPRGRRKGERVLDGVIASVGDKFLTRREVERRLRLTKSDPVGDTDRELEVDRERVRWAEQQLLVKAARQAGISVPAGSSLDSYAEEHAPGHDEEGVGRASIAPSLATSTSPSDA